VTDIRALSIASPTTLPLTDPHNAVPHAHHVGHKCQWSVW